MRELRYRTTRKDDNYTIEPGRRGGAVLVVAGSRAKVARDVHAAAAEADQKHRAAWVELGDVPQNLIHVLSSED